MGLLVNGFWRDKWYETAENKGAFEREDSSFRHWITADGITGDGKPTAAAGEGFRAEAGRYHLFVANACPWAHRTLIFRKLKQLETIIPVSIVHWFLGSTGWTFLQDRGTIPDTLYHSRYLHELYTRAKPEYTGRVTTPVLWDRRQETIVSNESAEIVRMLNCAFDRVGAAEGNYYPEALRSEIDEINERIYNTLNNGVYKCGFATSQEAFDDAIGPLTGTIDWLEERLSGQRYLCGDTITEADWRLFVTLVRYDAVYATHFKCTSRRIVDCPNLWAYTRELYQWPGIAETVDFDHIRRHYFASHETVNPHRIVPPMPALDFTVPHGRDSQ